MRWDAWHSSFCHLERRSCWKAAGIISETTAVPVWKRIQLRSTNCWGLVGRAYEINKKKLAEQIKFHFKRLRPVFGDQVASLVQECHVEDYKVQRSEQGASLAIISRELACLRRAFNLAIEEELIEKVPRFKLLPEPDTREGHHEPAEFTAFQRTARTIGCRKNFDGQVVADITLFREVRWQVVTLFLGTSSSSSYGTS